MARITKKIEIKNGKIIITKIKKTKICLGCINRPDEKRRMMRWLTQFLENGGTISNQDLSKLLFQTI